MKKKKKKKEPKLALHDLPEETGEALLRAVRKYFRRRTSKYMNRRWQDFAEGYRAARLDNSKVLVKEMESDRRGYEQHLAALDRRLEAEKWKSEEAYRRAWDDYKPRMEKMRDLIQEHLMTVHRLEAQLKERDLALGADFLEKHFGKHEERNL